MYGMGHCTNAFSPAYYHEDFISEAKSLQNGPAIITGTPVTAHAVINTFVREGHPGFDETMTLMVSKYYRP
jgi:hypothetical protein